MFCPECGSEIEEGTKFCGTCGSAVEDSVDNNKNSNDTPKTDSSQDNDNSSEKTRVIPKIDVSNDATQVIPRIQDNQNQAYPKKKQGKFATWLNKSTKNKILFFGTIGIIIIGAIIAFGVFSCVSDQDKMKSLIMESGLVKNGVVSQRYTKPTEYQVKEFNITNTNDSRISDNISNKYCEFDITIENESFRSQIKANCNFTIDNGNFSLQSDPNINEKNTTPLKGITDMEYSASSSNKDYEVIVTDFNSDFAESGDTYTSTATENIEYKFWFASDKGTVVQTFKFSNDSGWKTDGKQEISNKTTEWALSGKTFSYDNKASSSASSSDLQKKSTLTFKTSGPSNVISADYYVYREAEKKKPTDWSDYYEINKSGVVSGSPSHEFGSTSFSVTLTDGTITYKLSSPQKDTSGNTGETKYKFSVKLESELVYKSYSTVQTKYTDSFTIKEI